MAKFKVTFLLKRNGEEAWVSTKFECEEKDIPYKVARLFGLAYDGALIDNLCAMHDDWTRADHTPGQEWSTVPPGEWGATIPEGVVPNVYPPLPPLKELMDASSSETVHVLRQEFKTDHLSTYLHDKERTIGVVISGSEVRFYVNGDIRPNPDPVNNIGLYYLGEAGGAMITTLHADRLQDARWVRVTTEPSPWDGEEEKR